MNQMNTIVSVDVLEEVLLLGAVRYFLSYFPIKFWFDYTKRAILWFKSYYKGLYSIYGCTGKQCQLTASAHSMYLCAVIPSFNVLPLK